MSKRRSFLAEVDARSINFQQVKKNLEEQISIINAGPKLPSGADVIKHKIRQPDDRLLAKKNFITPTYNNEKTKINDIISKHISNPVEKVISSTNNKNLSNNNSSLPKLSTESNKITDYPSKNLLGNNSNVLNEIEKLKSQVNQNLANIKKDDSSKLDSNKRLFNEMHKLQSDFKSQFNKGLKDIEESKKISNTSQLANANIENIKNSLFKEIKELKLDLQNISSKAQQKNDLESKNFTHIYKNIKEELAQFKDSFKKDIMLEIKDLLKKDLKEVDKQSITNNDELLNNMKKQIDDLSAQKLGNKNMLSHTEDFNQNMLSNIAGKMFNGYQNNDNVLKDLIQYKLVSNLIKEDDGLKNGYFDKNHHLSNRDSQLSELLLQVKSLSQDIKYFSEKNNASEIKDNYENYLNISQNVHQKILQDLDSLSKHHKQSVPTYSIANQDINAYYSESLKYLSSIKEEQQKILSLIDKSNNSDDIEKKKIFSQVYTLLSELKDRDNLIDTFSIELKKLVEAVNSNTSISTANISQSFANNNQDLLNEISNIMNNNDIKNYMNSLLFKFDSLQSNIEKIGIEKLNIEKLFLDVRSSLNNQSKILEIVSSIANENALNKNVSAEISSFINENKLKHTEIVSLLEQISTSKSKETNDLVIDIYNLLKDINERNKVLNDLYKDIGVSKDDSQKIDALLYSLDELNNNVINNNVIGVKSLNLLEDIKVDSNYSFQSLKDASSKLAMSIDDIQSNHSKLAKLSLANNKEEALLEIKNAVEIINTNNLDVKKLKDSFSSKLIEIEKLDPEFKSNDYHNILNTLSNTLLEISKKQLDNENLLDKLNQYNEKKSENNNDIFLKNFLEFSNSQTQNINEIKSYLINNINSLSSKDESNKAKELDKLIFNFEELVKIQNKFFDNYQNESANLLDYIKDVDNKISKYMNLDSKANSMNIVSNIKDILSDSSVKNNNEKKIDVSGNMEHLYGEISKKVKDYYRKNSSTDKK